MRFERQAVGAAQVPATGGEFRQAGQALIGLGTAALNLRGQLLDRAQVELERDINAQVQMVTSKYDGTDPTQLQSMEAELAEIGKVALRDAPEGREERIQGRLERQFGLARAGLTQSVQRHERSRQVASMGDAITFKREELETATRLGDDEAAEALLEDIASHRQRLVELGEIDEAQAGMEAAKDLQIAQAGMVLAEFEAAPDKAAYLEGFAKPPEGMSADTFDKLRNRMNTDVSRERVARRRDRAEQRSIVTANNKAVRAMVERAKLGVLGEEEAPTLIAAATGELPVDESVMIRAQKAVASRAQALESAGFSSAEREAEMQAIRSIQAQGVPNVTQAAALEGQLEALRAQEREFNRDPMDYAITRNPKALHVGPLDVANPEVFGGQMAGMAENQQKGADEYDDSEFPGLTNGQAAEIAGALQASTADEKARILGQIDAAFGDGAAEVYRQLGEKGDSSLPVVGYWTQAGYPDRAREILMGEDVRKGPNSKLFQPTGEERGAVLSAEGVTVAHMGAGRVRQIAAAADAVYAARGAAEGDTSGEFSPGRYEEAVQFVTGGVLNLGGRPFLAPGPDVTEDQFQMMLERMTEPDVAAMGGIGRTASGAVVSPTDIATEGQFLSLEPGVYHVQVGGEVVLDRDGEPFELDYSEIHGRGGQAPDLLPASRVMPALKAGDKALREFTEEMRARVRALVEGE